MKKVKHINKYLPLLLLGLFGTGYSSRALNYSTSTKINIEKGAILELDNFILFDNDISMFSYCPYGLLENETIVSTGTIKIGLTFKDIETFITQFAENNITLNFSFKSTCTNNTSFNIFNYLSNTNPCKYSLTESNSTIEYVNDITDVINNSSETSINYQVEIQDLSAFTANEFYISFMFPFDFSSVINFFNEEVYQFIKNDGLIFSLSVSKK